MTRVYTPPSHVVGIRRYNTYMKQETCVAMKVPVIVKVEIDGDTQVHINVTDRWLVTVRDTTTVPQKYCPRGLSPPQAGLDVRSSRASQVGCRTVA